MPHPDPSRDEAIRRLDEQAAALEKRTTREPRDYGSKAAGYGYRLLGVLLGGLGLGLGLGFGADAVLGSAPWGMIVGVLVGFVVSVWMAVRSARQMTAEAERLFGPPRDLPPDDDEED